MGLAQAASAAPALAAMAPDLIISSDLRRTTRTAGFLADLTGLQIELDPRLRERHFGRWQGLPSTRSRSTTRTSGPPRSGASIADDGVEPLATLGSRTAAALVEIATRVGESGVAVVVTHGGAARAGAGTLLELPQARWHALGVLTNCAISDLRWNPVRAWVLHAHNVVPAG